jgi:glycosyltransferase involved in cell wall biosynthesis
MFGAADKINMANAHRAAYAKSVIKHLKDKEITVIDNYPFSFFQTKEMEVETFKKKKGIKYLLHQGEINENRGIELVSEVLENLPDNWRLVILGLSFEKYEKFIGIMPEYKEKIVNGGRVPNDQIIAAYKNFDASIVFYKTEKINEKFCAPNRLYQAANAGLPLIVNNNPVLSDFVNQNKTGLIIDLKTEETDQRVVEFFGNYQKYRTNALRLKNKFLYEDKVAPVLLRLYGPLISN